ncbi:hypothetical protein L3095_000438 [Campylobacter jejuni]|nr:hypothetical protein [Campylobacter jejuni]EIU0790662.1 hypothetical protein [Campylobacter jejuni]
MQPKSIILFFYGYILFFRRHLNSCSMCGKMCAMNTMNQILKGEDVSLA